MQDRLINGVALLLQAVVEQAIHETIRVDGAITDAHIHNSITGHLIDLYGSVVNRLLLHLD